MKYQVIKTLTVTNDRGIPKVYPSGAVIPAKVYVTLSAHAKAKCVPVPQSNNRMNWSKVEVRHIAKVYLKNVDVDGKVSMNDVYAQHQQVFPDRGMNAVSLEIGQILFLDTYVPQKGMHDVSQTLVDVLHEIDPIRFSSQTKSEAKLDALLAQVRA